MWYRGQNCTVITAESSSGTDVMTPLGDKVSTGIDCIMSRCCRHLQSQATGRTGKWQKRRDCHSEDTVTFSVCRQAQQRWHQQPRLQPRQLSDHCSTAASPSQLHSHLTYTLSRTICRSLQQIATSYLVYYTQHNVKLGLLVQFV